MGFREQENIVFHLHNGSPVFCHEKTDLNNFRYITANLVVSGLCRSSELLPLGVSSRNMQQGEHKKSGHFEDDFPTDAGKASQPRDRNKEAIDVSGIFGVATGLS